MTSKECMEANEQVMLTRRFLLMPQFWMSVYTVDITHSENIPNG